VRLLEPRIAFFPFRGETTTPRDLGLEYEPLTISTRDGEQLRAWFISPPSPVRMTPGFGEVNSAQAFVLYFHGNGANLSNWAPIVCAIARQGYSVLAFDYRGYGVSTGNPTERGLYRDVDAIVEHVWTRIKPAGTVIYWGRSLGVSMAAYAAARGRADPLGPPESRADLSGPPRHTPHGLILESGFPDARSLFSAPSPMAFLALFSSYRFPAADFLRASQLPALVMHGDADSVIPYDRGRALYEQIEGPKQFFKIKGGDHNDARPMDERGYWQAVDGFVAGLGR
jgi:fermentation-respiration switch protein FrsA (DUF1100 family)